MIPPGFLRVQDDAVMLALKVQPRASRSELAGPLGNELKVKVTAPPVDSAANGAVIAFLAERLGLQRRQVTLVRGQTSTHKTLRLDGITLDEAARRLT